MSTLYRFTPDGTPPRPGAAETWQFTSRPGGGVDVVHFRRTAAEYERSLPAQVLEWRQASYATSSRKPHSRSPSRGQQGDAANRVSFR